jgi:hypothetical protein
MGYQVGDFGDFGMLESTTLASPFLFIDEGASGSVEIMLLRRAHH